MKTRNTAILCLCLAALIVLSSCGRGKTQAVPGATPSPTAANAEKTAGNTPSPSPTAGAAPGLQIDTVTLFDEPVTSEVFHNNDLTVLNIWATWCPPCIEELPHLQEVSERFQDRNVQILGVLSDGITELGVPDNDAIAAAKALLSDAGANYPVVLPDETLLLEFIVHMQYVPTTFFIDTKGEVIDMAVGSNDADGWEEVINEVLSAVSK